MQIGEKIPAIQGTLLARHVFENDIFRPQGHLLQRNDFETPFDLIGDLEMKKHDAILVFCKFSDLLPEEKEILDKHEEEFSQLQYSFYTLTNDTPAEVDNSKFSIVTSSDVPVSNGKTILLVSSDGTIKMIETVETLSQPVFGFFNKQIQSPIQKNFPTEIVSKHVAGLLNSYTLCLKESPILTKSVTSCVIAAIGEIIGSAIHNYRSQNLKNRSLNQTSRSTWEIIHRLLVFGAFGLSFTGPFFHWWYGNLHQFVNSWNLPKSLSVIIKVLLNQLVMTPPYLVFTISYLQFFLTFDREKTVKTLKSTFATALFMNWKVWTFAQAVNFSVVPPDYQVLFGNIIALWWNIYLSLISSSASK